MRARPRTPQARLPPVERPSRAWLVVSTLLHAALIGAAVVQGLTRTSDARLAGTGDPARSGGGGGVRITPIQLPAYEHPASAVVPVPERPRQPPPLLPEPLPIPSPQAQPAVALVEPEPQAGPGSRDRGPGAGTGSGGGVGAGQGPGTGSGAGPGEGGEEGETFPPRARYSILPPLPQPASVRGRSFRVTFWVDAAGRVRKVEVDPQIADGSYRRRFLDLMYEYTFEPARRADGTRVDGEAVITITL